MSLELSMKGRLGVTWEQPTACNMHASMLTHYSGTHNSRFLPHAWVMHGFMHIGSCRYMTTHEAVCRALAVLEGEGGGGAGLLDQLLAPLKLWTTLQVPGQMEYRLPLSYSDAQKTMHVHPPS